MCGMEIKSVAHFGFLFIPGVSFVGISESTSEIFLNGWYGESLLSDGGLRRYDASSESAHVSINEARRTLIGVLGLPFCTPPLSELKPPKKPKKDESSIPLTSRTTCRRLIASLGAVDL